MVEDRLKSGIMLYLIICDGCCVEVIIFYVVVFGVEECFCQVEEQGEWLMYVVLVINGDFVLMYDDFLEYCGGVLVLEFVLVVLYLVVDDVDVWWICVVEVGVEVMMLLVDQFWGDCYGYLKDLFGYIWLIGVLIKV